MVGGSGSGQVGHCMPCGKPMLLSHRYGHHRMPCVKLLLLCHHMPFFAIVCHHMPCGKQRLLPRRYGTSIDWRCLHHCCALLLKSVILLQTQTPGGGRPTGTIRSHWTLCWRLPGPHLSRSAHLAPPLQMAPKRSPANSSCGSSSWSGSAHNRASAQRSPRARRRVLTRQHRSPMMVSTNSCSHGDCVCA